MFARFELVDEDIGDVLFGESSSAEDVSKWINGKSEEF